MSDEHEIFEGAFVRGVPSGLMHRLTAHAAATLRRELRYFDHDAHPVEILEQFLGSREGGPARSLPTPSAEPGDLLVKVARAETWGFTVQGWRELAPVSLSTWHNPDPPFPPDEQEPGIIDDEADVIVLIEQGIVVTDFPSWAEPVLCKPGTLHNLGGLVVIRRDPPPEAHPESLDVDAEIDLNRILDEGGEIRKRAGYDWPPLDDRGGVKGLGVRPIPGFDDAARTARETRDHFSGGINRDAPQGAAFISESATLPPPWEPDERQQQILDELDEQAAELERTLATMLDTPFDVDPLRMELRAYRAGLVRARSVIRYSMGRLYGPQGIG